MDVEPGGEIHVDIVGKSQELLMPMPSVAIGDRHAARHIHSRKQESDFVPFIIMRLTRRHTGRDLQNRLRPEGLPVFGRRPIIVSFSFS